jgi:hypothetical protein
MCNAIQQRSRQARQQIASLVCAKQRGGMMATLILLVLMVWGSIIGFKVFQAYTEFDTIKEAVVSAKIGSTNPQSMRQAIKSKLSEANAIKAPESFNTDDIDIDTENDKVVIKFKYNKKIQLFKNISLLVELKGEA